MGEIVYILEEVRNNSHDSNKQKEIIGIFREFSDCLKELEFVKNEELKQQEWHEYENYLKFEDSEDFWYVTYEDISEDVYCLQITKMEVR